MPTKYRPYWSPQDSQDLQRAINKFNRKLARLEKANPELKGLLPERAKFSFYRSAINNKIDLRREINSLNRFSKPGAEKLKTIGVNNAQVTKWQLEESRRRVKGINKRREERLNYILGQQVTTENQPRNYTRADMGLSDMKLRQFRPLNITTKAMTQQDVGEKWKTIVSQSSKGYYKKSDYQWRENYIKSLEDNFGSNADEIIEQIRDMDIEEFKKVMYSDTEAGIEFNYVGNFGEVQQRLPQLYRLWKVPYSETLDKNLEQINAYENEQRSVSVPNDIEYYNV